MTTEHLRPIDEEAILRCFTSSDGLPLVLERALQDDRGLLSVEKLHDARHKLDTVADLIIDPATGQVTKHTTVNEHGQWHESQIDLWVREAELVLVDHVGTHAAPPSRSDVDRWWRDLIAGRITRDQAHRLAAPWPPHIARVNDPVTRRGLYRLFTYNRAYLNPDKGITVHTNQDDAWFVHGKGEIAADYAAWKAQCR